MNTINLKMLFENGDKEISTLDHVRSAKQLIAEALGAKDAEHLALTAEILAVGLDAVAYRFAAQEALASASSACQGALEELQDRTRTVQVLMQDNAELRQTLIQQAADIAIREATLARREAELPVPARNGKEWKQSEEYYLLKYYREGKSESEIARRLKRYGDAVCVHLGKLENDGVYWDRPAHMSEEFWTGLHREHFFKHRYPGPLLWAASQISPNTPPHLLQAYEAVPLAVMDTAKAA
ncbi:MAG TPA: hypothetical protein VFA39_15865 [Steroidobacteraceae bacterium]|nr:hypothetical protein [Steroidobacteraceae bacterium]